MDACRLLAERKGTTLSDNMDAVGCEFERRGMDFC